jgi:hypothetical protein
MKTNDGSSDGQTLKMFVPSDTEKLQVLRVEPEFFRQTYWLTHSTLWHQVYIEIPHDINHPV